MTLMMMMVTTFHIVFYIAECRSIKLRVIQVEALKRCSSLLLALQSRACTCMHECKQMYEQTVATSDALIVVGCKPPKSTYPYKNSIRIAAKQIVWFVYVFGMASLISAISSISLACSLSLRQT